MTTTSERDLYYIIQSAIEQIVNKAFSLFGHQVRQVESTRCLDAGKQRFVVDITIDSGGWEDDIWGYWGWIVTYLSHRQPSIQDSLVVKLRS